MSEESFKAALAAAEGFLALGDAPEAWEILISLPEAERHEAPVYLLRVTILLSLEQWEKAEDLAQAGVELEPGVAELWYLLAVAQAKQDKQLAALHAAKEACALDTSLREVVLADDALIELWDDFKERDGLA